MAKKLKREAIVINASVFDSLPTYGNKYKKERDVWFSILVSYKKNNIFKSLRVPISPDADLVDINYLQKYIARKVKIKANDVLFKEEPIVALWLNNIIVKDPGKIRVEKRQKIRVN